MARITVLFNPLDATRRRVYNVPAGTDLLAYLEAAEPCHGSMVRQVFNQGTELQVDGYLVGEFDELLVKMYPGDWVTIGYYVLPRRRRSTASRRPATSRASASRSRSSSGTRSRSPTTPRNPMCSTRTTINFSARSFASGKASISCRSCCSATRAPRACRPMSRASRSLIPTITARPMG